MLLGLLSRLVLPGLKANPLPRPLKPPLGEALKPLPLKPPRPLGGWVGTKPELAASILKLDTLKDFSYTCTK